VPRLLGQDYTRTKSLLFYLQKKSGRETAAEQKRLQPLLRKVCRDGAKVTCSGRLYQVREAAVGYALSPTVDSQLVGTVYDQCRR